MRGYNENAEGLRGFLFLNDIGCIGDGLVIHKIIAFEYDIVLIYVNEEAFTLGGVTYQRYNFGYLNNTTKMLVSTTEALKPADGELFGGYLSLKDRDEEHDMRVIFVTDVEAFEFESATVSIVFKLGDTVAKTLQFTLGGAENDFVAYKTAVAAGERYFAEEGYELLGVVITDIPDGAWDTLSVEITENATADPLFTGSAAYAE